MPSLALWEVHAEMGSKEFMVRCRMCRWRIFHKDLSRIQSAIQSHHERVHRGELREVRGDWRVRTQTRLPELSSS